MAAEAPPKLHLVFPELFRRRIASPREMPSLTTLLKRADRYTLEADSFEQLAFGLFGVTPEPARDMPIAAVMAAGRHGRDDGGYWLRADPVHLIANRDQLVMQDPDILELDNNEAAQLVSEIQQLYAGDGWRLQMISSHQWLLRLPEPMRVRTHSPAEVIGRDIHPCLPAGTDGRYWQTVLNEIQMLLHQSDVNVRRREADRPEANSVWFWGSGTAPSVVNRRWTSVWNGEAVTSGLAVLAGLTPQPQPAGFDAWLANAHSDEEHLVVLDMDAVTDLEQYWMQPVLAALRGRRVSVALYPGDGMRYDATRRSLRRWWRRLSG